MPKEISPEYLAYLSSREWQLVRQEAFRLFGDRCLACRSLVKVQQHHVHYPPNIWDTKPEHLMPLCTNCHKAVHRQREFYPTTRDPVYCSGKRNEILNYLARIVAVTRYPRQKNHDRSRRPASPRRIAFFSAFPGIRAAMLEHIATTHQRNHPFIARLAIRTTDPHTSIKLFKQIIGHRSAASWLQVNSVIVKA